MRKNTKKPTNHLDAEMAEWLENYLKNYRGTMVMVTHDRYFLDSVCNRIVEVDKGKIYSYDTNYSGFLAAKQEREEPKEKVMILAFLLFILRLKEEYSKK